MTTPTVNMPPLPEPAGWLITYSMDGEKRRTLCGHNSRGDYCQFDPGATSEPVYTHAYAQAYADQRCAELEAKLAAAEKRIAELEFMVFKMGHRAQYTPSTHTSSVLHIFSNKVIWTGHDTGTELSLKLAFEATAKEQQ